MNPSCGPDCCGGLPSNLPGTTRAPGLLPCFTAKAMRKLAIRSPTSSNSSKVVSQPVTKFIQSGIRLVGAIV